MAKYIAIRKSFGSKDEPGRMFEEGEIVEMDPKKVTKNFKLYVKKEDPKKKG